MNDKNFIEELRQKREEYGVTQTRLAVACGISREYYNRIEKGKQPLNDELREIIEKQIERFNPQEPLFLLIDYFRVRFPTTDALAIIRDVLQLKSNYMLYEDYGKYGYESKYVLGDINIMCSMQEHLGVLLELGDINIMCSMQEHLGVLLELKGKKAVGKWNVIYWHRNAHGMTSCWIV